MYDVYYTTGGGPWVNAGTDTWVNLWMELVAPKLEVKPILLLHRNKPNGYEDYEFPIVAQVFLISKRVSEPELFCFQHYSWSR